MTEPVTFDQYACPMAAHPEGSGKYRDEIQVLQNHLTLSTFPDSPRWRAPQLGALEAISSYWSLEDPEPALASIPTGSGKTAVAVALRYMAQARRTLVVVPSQDLRRQIAEEFASERTVRDLGALEGDSFPQVYEHVGRGSDWDELRKFDVVVAIPASISPSVMKDHPPPRDLFDLIIVDEAHHAPATTWKAILDHFESARSVLLTATPRRRDGKPLPGKHVFHYPLRLALKHGIYKVVEPRILDLSPHITAEVRDQSITDEIVALAESPEHTTSAVLVRAASVERAIELAGKYSARGLECLPLHNRLSKKERALRVDSWRAGSPRALAVVDMLGEGIDVANLRLVGYHDKHKSNNATVQLIGRLARANASYPQSSVLVTARDQDVFPALQGTLRLLYEEDSDWATVLPSLIDAELEADRLRRDFASQFHEPPTSLSLASVRPMARLTVFESSDSSYSPQLGSGLVPEELRAGRIIRGQEIVYSGIHSSGSILMLITSAPSLPRWYDDDSLTQASFDLHVVSWHEARDVALPNLLFLNTQDAHIAREIRRVLDPLTHLQLGKPDAMQEVFESLDRVSVSNVGVRNTHRGAAGTTTYATFAGSGVDRGLREADTQGRGLGHAMAQVFRAGSTVTAGFSAAKAKYWETRYVSLVEYDDLIADFATRYWRPQLSASGTFLPNVSRPTRTEAFASEGLIAELSPALRGEGWRLENHVPVEDLDIEVTQTSNLSIGLNVIVPATGEIVWSGEQKTNGEYVQTSASLKVRRGEYRELIPLAHLLEKEPPSIYLADGSTVYGAVTYAPTTTQTFLPSFTYSAWDWSTVDILKESKKSGRDDTIHDEIERRLNSVTSSGRKWVLCNDGGGEIADHIVIKEDLLGRIHVELWHAKASSNIAPGVRVTDMQVVAAQALKSRRHFTDKDFWSRLGRRLDGNETPRAILVGGDLESLRALCGLVPERELERIDQHPPSVTGRVVVVQPGLSISQLQNDVESEPVEISVGQVREFLIALHNATAGSVDVEIIGSE